MKIQTLLTACFAQDAANLIQDYKIHAKIHYPADFSLHKGSE
jgi:hypothetical protein